jgi:hypothetical protein
VREPDDRKADILDAVRNRDGLVIATGSVAEAADMSRPTARKYLEQLEEEGEVVEEDLAGRMYVWYTPEVLESGVGASASEPTHDGGADGPDGAVLRRGAIAVLEAFEEDAARVSQQALTYGQMDLRRHFARLLVAGFGTVAFTALIVAHGYTNFLTGSAYIIAGLMWAVSLLGLAGSVAAAMVAYGRAERDIQGESSFPLGGSADIVSSAEEEIKKRERNRTTAGE